MDQVSRCAQPVIFFVAVLLAVTGAMYAQEALPIRAPSTPNFGVPEDWSTPHVIYTRNGAVDDMLKVRNDPRFLNNILLHYIREHGKQTQPTSPTGLEGARSNENGFEADAEELRIQGSGNEGNAQSPGPTANGSKVDWAVSLGPTAGMALAESPAKYTFNPSAPPSCSDFVVYTVNAAPKVGTQANLVGLTNLYSGSNPTGLCGNAPTFLFSYAIGASGSALSPVLSLDGTQVAWLENANPVVLHVTTFMAGQGTNATTGAVAPTGTFSSSGTCTPSPSSCDVALSYTTVAGCTASSNSNSDSDIYVDYGSNSAYVSANNGILYRISGIFHAVPAVEYCVTVNGGAGAYMSGPVYDSLLNEVFVTDSKKVYAYTVGAAGFTAANPASYTYAVGGYDASAPVLDAFNGYLYIFSTDDAEATAHTSVIQLPVTLAAGSGTFVPLGAVGTGVDVYLGYGAFDNNYYNYGPKNAASTLYSCGTDTTTTTAQDLFAISFNPSTGVANTTPAMPANKNVNPGGKTGLCSPITEFFDGTTDRIFVGMGDYSGATTGANVVQMWNVTTQLKSSSDTPTASASGYQGGTTGFAIDNNASGTAQAESIYFSTLETSGTATTCGAAGTDLYCAVKLTQSGLQ
jgi:hypothetical protein